ncbi:13477_t:CDS:2, partial [Cetraspora pellucida]
SLQSKSSTLNTLTMPLQLPILAKAITSSQTVQLTASTQLTNLNNSLQSISLTKKRKADAATSDLPMTTTSNKFSKQSSISFILSIRQKSFTQIEHITRKQAKLEYFITEQRKQLEQVLEKLNDTEGMYNSAMSKKNGKRK